MEEHPPAEDGVQEIFALNPATATEGGINYNTPEGRKIYKDRVSKLQEEQYDCNAENMFQFLQALSDRAAEFGWDEGILEIPTDEDEPMGVTMNLLTQYGQVTLEQIRRWERQYVNNGTQAAQDNYVLYRCIMNSLSAAGQNKILVWKNEYTVNGVGLGPFHLKIVIRESHLDTNGTSAAIRRKLNALDTKMVALDSDVLKFNQYVLRLVEQLAVRGEQTMDLLINLFKGYMAASDKNFLDYITRKEEAYSEGNDITYTRLMQMAANKCKNLKQEGK